ncbi:MAG: glycoside hydrolase [Bacteroidales bacterium]
MNTFIKLLKYISLCIIPLFFSCKDSEEVLKQLYFVDNTLPAEDLSAKGGTFSFEVEWAYTQWRVLSGAVIKGQQFIENISPGIAGSVEGKFSQTTVNVDFKANSTHEINSQELILASLDGKFREEIVLSQSPLGFEPFDLIIDPVKTYQTITGFGGANMIWGSDYLSTAEMELAFGTDDGLGLSILRVRLSSNKSDWAGLVSVIKNANARGVKVLASPWSPPAAWKSNNSTNGGGYLLPERYGDFAGYINEFITYMSTNGAVVDVVSIQNEPDWKVNYEGCEYTIPQMYNFVKNNAGSVTAAKVLAAESLNFKHTYTDDILNDPVAVNNIDIVGFHIYGSGKQSYPLAVQKGKEVWMTEHLYNLNSGNIPGNWTDQTNPEIIWDETMTMLTDINDGMAFNWNAYIWWYIRRYYSFLGDGERGTSRGTILKRGYAMSQYSKFIRPGYVRIDAEFDFAIDGIKVTAYKGDESIVAVIINTTGYNDYKVNLMAPSVVTSAVSYTTSLSLNRNKEILTPIDKNILINIPAKSITTVVFAQ